MSTHPDGNDRRPLEAAATRSDGGASPARAGGGVTTGQLPARLTDALPSAAPSAARGYCFYPDPYEASAGGVVQRKANDTALADGEHAGSIAARGVSGPGERLPFLDAIQASFGRHDLSSVRAHTGETASVAATAIGADAYATGQDVAFSASPDLHTAAHEAAHTVQQRSGIQLKDGLGRQGDEYEQHADAVADRVVRGEDAESLLDDTAGGDVGAKPLVQLKKRSDRAEGGIRQGSGASLAAAAANAKEAAEFAALALATSKSPDADLIRLEDALDALGDALHEYAGDHAARDDRAVNGALRAAGHVASALELRSGPHDARANRLRQLMRTVDGLASSRDEAPRGPADVTPSELVPQVARSLAQLEAARDLASLIPDVDRGELERAIEKTSGWHETLAAPEANAADARRLSTAVLQQQAILFDADVELQDVLAKPPGPGTAPTVRAYLHAMAASTGRRNVAEKALDGARLERRRMPLAIAAATLDADRGATIEIEERDATAGHTARREHRDLARRHAALDKKVVHGQRVSDHDLRKLEVDAREQSFRHHSKLFELQARQLARALGESDDGWAGVPNKFDLEMATLRTDLLSLAEEFPLERQRYQRRVDKANDAYDGDLEGLWDLLHAREIALDEAQGRLADFLTKSEFMDALQAAQAKAKQAQTRAFAMQLLTTIAITLAGNVAAAGARGTAEGAWAARAARAGTADTAVAAAEARAVGQVVGVGADVAVNTGGMLLQGDDRSLVTILTLNVLNPLIIGKIHTRFPQLEHINASAALWKRALGRTGVSAYDKLELSVEMISGAALDYATTRLLEAKAHNPTDQEAEQWLYQGAAMALGRHLGTKTKAFSSRLQKLEAHIGSRTFDLLHRASQVSSDAAAVSSKGVAADVDPLLSAYDKLLVDAATAADAASSDTGVDARSPTRAPFKPTDDAGSHPARQHDERSTPDSASHDPNAPTPNAEETTPGTLAARLAPANATPADVAAIERVLALDEREGALLVREYGEEMTEYLAFNPLPGSIPNLRKALAKERAQVTQRVRGFFEGVDSSKPPDGWTFTDTISYDGYGTKILKTEVVGPNGARGLFERGYNAATKDLELRMAFLKMSGQEVPLPSKVAKQGSGAEMLEGSGSPTVQYITLYQMKKLGVALGAPASASVDKIHMSDIQNVETIVHLHWLKANAKGEVHDLIAHTQSVQYAETTAVQSGYERAGDPYLSGGQVSPIDEVLKFQERGNQARKDENNALLAKYGFDRTTEMLWGFDIDFPVRPTK